MGIPKAGETRMPHSWRPAIPFCIYGLLASAPTIMVATHIPAQSKTYWGSDSEAAKWSALFISLAAVITLGTTGLVGLIGDTVGRYPVLVAASWVGVIPLCLNCIFSPTNMYVYVAATNLLPALVGSTSFGSITMVTAAIGDLYVAEERAGPMMLTMAMFFLGVMLAALPDGLQWSNDTTNIVSCVASLANLLFVWAFVPETLKEENRRTHEMSLDNISFATHDDAEARSGSKWAVALRELRQPLAPLRYVFRSRFLLTLCIVTVSYVLPLAVAESIAFYYFNSCCDFTSGDNGIYLATLGGSYIVYSFTLLPLMFRRLHVVTILAIAMATLVVHQVTLALIHARWQVVAIVGPLAGFPFLALGVLAQIGSTVSTAAEQGTVLGALTAFRGLCNALGPLIGSAMYSAGGGRLDFPALPWVVCAIVAALGSLLCVFSLRPMVLDAETGASGTQGEDTPDDSTTTAEPLYRERARDYRSVNEIRESA